jgi:hypothetical protein
MFPCHWAKFQYIRGVDDLEFRRFIAWIELHEDGAVNMAYDEEFHRVLESCIIPIENTGTISGYIT